MKERVNALQNNNSQSNSVRGIWTVEKKLVNEQNSSTGKCVAIHIS